MHRSPTDTRRPALSALATLLGLAASPSAFAGADLIDGLGGSAGFGVNYLARNDDGYSSAIDISSIFPVGLDFYGSTYTEIYVNNNGNLSFSSPVSGFTPVAMPSSSQPMLATWWLDVDTRGTTGISSEENLVYYYIDETEDRFIATWYTVGYYSSHTDLLNSFQAIVTNRDDRAPGDFDVEYRYNRCEWITGDASGGSGGFGGTPGQMGFDAGNYSDYWSHPDSRTADIIYLCDTSNVGDEGVWQFQIESGSPVVCGDGIVSGDEECDDGNYDSNDGCTSCIVYDDADGDGFYADVDCDDDDAGIHPDALEVCDGVDNDCDGTVDEGFDADRDGWSTCEDDCDDTDRGVYPGAPDTWYDGIDSDCAGNSDYDADYDGFDSDDYGGGDCDDLDADVYPGAADTWYDGVDSDCDGASDYDADYDGYDSAEYGGDDCDDADAAINPDALETWYDGIDSDCDEWSDYDADYDGYDSDAWGGEDCDDGDRSVHPGAPETWYDGIDSDCDGADDFDADGDGYGSDEHGGDDCDDADSATHPGASDSWYDGVDSDCDGADDYDADGDGYGSDEYGGDDCDDAAGDINPGAEEECDGIDEDCDGEIDEGTDCDDDGYTEEDGDCDDADPDTYPGADELCDGKDNDCDGEVPADEADADGDGYRICDDDCDDDNAQTYPGAPEQCDGEDNDCDGEIDEDVDEDLDGDGYDACQGDCDNEDADVYPGAEEVCDDKDNDCDGVVDLPECDDSGVDSGEPLDDIGTYGGGCTCSAAPGGRSGLAAALGMGFLLALVGLRRRD